MTGRDPQDDGFDGVRESARPGRAHWGWLALIVVILVGAAVAWLIDGSAAPRAGRAGMEAGPDRARADETSSGSAAGPGDGRPATGAGAAPPPVASRAAIDGEDPTPDLSDYVLPGEAPTMAQVIDALHARGIRTGLGAFPPPGTSPPLQGLEVPDGFPLPDGYVRHHQVTDDGQRIAPILMFAPDRDTLVVRGVRTPIPSDRVVPPELAPPGMPLRRVRIPPPRDGGGRP